jgi:hypothetical protein
VNGPAPQAPEPELEPLDLAAILEEGPPRRTAILDMQRLDLNALGVGEILELSRAAGVDPEELGGVMRKGNAAAKGRLAIALAWVIARRREPGLELEDVERWAIEVRGAPPAGPTRPLENGSSSSGQSGSSTSPSSRASRRARRNG